MLFFEQRLGTLVKMHGKSDLVFKERGEAKRIAKLKLR